MAQICYVLGSLILKDDGSCSRTDADVKLTLIYTDVAKISLIVDVITGSSIQVNMKTSFVVVTSHSHDLIWK